MNKEILIDSILNTVDAAVIIVDRETHNVIDVNTAAVRMFGVSKDNIVGMLCHKFVCPYEVNECPVMDLGKTVYRAEKEFTKPSGEIIPVLKSVFCMDMDNRRYLVETLVDITERKRAEEALRASEEKYRALFEESKDAVFMSIPAGRFLDMNAAGVELFGYASTEEILNIDIRSQLYVNPDDRTTYQTMLAEKGFVKDFEVEMKKKTGEKLNVLLTSSTVTDGNGNIVAYRGIIRDITEHKKLEQQLLQSQKMEAVGQLAGGVAHDFNNILTAIMGFTSLILMKTQEAPTKTYADQILTLSGKAAELTQSLLAFSRKQIINPRPADINDIVKQINKLLRRIIGEDIELNIVLSEESVTAIVDRAQLEHVLMNLATNARDAMPNGGALTIKTESTFLDKEFIDTHGYGDIGSYALLSVADTGTGIEEKSIKRIFEPFFTTKEVGKGTGLGLAMVYGIIKQHNGFVNVYSEPGQGTIFRIYIPAIQVKEEVAEIVEQAALKGGTETILLAEDETETRKVTKAILEEFGYKVIEASDGDEALRQYLENQDSVDLLLSDVIMPKKNGREVYEEIQRIRPGIKTLFTSGYTGDVIRKQGFLKEGLELISKPIMPKELLLKIREILDK